MDTFYIYSSSFCSFFHQDKEPIKMIYLTEIKDAREALG